jgi:AcrR family transcriptional regulator
MFMSSREAKAGARKRSRPASSGAPARESTGAGGGRQSTTTRGDNGEGRVINGEGREKVSEIQRARILTAMTEVASERGAANVTVAHVVARSGVSRRTFYELFEDREACFLAAFEDAARHIAARVIPAYQGERRWRDRIRAGLQALLDFLDEEPEVGRLCIAESLAAGPLALERRAHVLEIVKRALEEGHKETKSAREPPPLTAEGVIGAVSSVLHARLTKSNPSTPRGAGPPKKSTPKSGSPAGNATKSGSLTESATKSGSHAGSATGSGSFAELLNPLMGMIVLPYQGTAAATREVARPRPSRPRRPRDRGRDPLRELDMRLTYRTVRVLMAVGTTPGASNRRLADAAGVHDQGQISKLLARLKTLGLIENVGAGPVKGEPNAWQLTVKGSEVGQAIQVQTQV